MFAANIHYAVNEVTVGTNKAIVRLTRYYFSVTEMIVENITH
jgi:hypothetical protein